MTDRRLDWRTGLMLLAVAALWGSAFMLIKVAVEDGVTTIFISASRCLIGALVLVPLAVVMPGRPADGAPATGAASLRATLASLPRGAHVALAVTGLFNAVPFQLISWGEQFVDSSIAGIAITTVPLWTALMATRFDHGHRTWWLQWAGLGLGFVGVVLLLGTRSRLDDADAVLLGLAAILVAALLHAISNIVVRTHLSSVPPTHLGAASLTWATLFLAPFALADLPRAMPSATAVASLVALGVFSTGLGYFYFFRLIHSIGATRAALVAYLMPPIAVLYGVTLLHERTDSASLAAMVVILVGVVLGVRPAPSPPPTVEVTGGRAGT